MNRAQLPLRSCSKIEGFCKILNNLFLKICSGVNIGVKHRILDWLLS